MVAKARTRADKERKSLERAGLTMPLTSHQGQSLLFPSTQRSLPKTVKTEYSEHLKGHFAGRTMASVFGGRNNRKEVRIKKMYSTNTH